MRIHISYAYGCPDVTLLREFCSYDIQCPECCEFVPEPEAELNYKISSTSLTSLHWSRQYEYPWALGHSNLKPTDVCLDAGGAYAVFKYALAKRCEKVITIDTNQDYLDKSIKSAERLGFNNIEFLNCAIENYQTEQRFDKIYCLSVLEHIQDKNARFACLQNMFKLLKKDGELYLTFDMVLENGETTFDFYINRSDAAEILQFFGIQGFNDDKYYTAKFPGGCVLATLCLKVWDI